MPVPLSPEVVEQAATWFVDLRDMSGDDSLRQAHRHWLSESPAHRRAWARVEKLQQCFGGLPRGVAHETLNIARGSRRETIKALSLLLLAGGGASAWRQRLELQAMAADYRTLTGEQRHITLADGSRLQLNTATRVDINYDARRREVVLFGGEILVETAEDPGRRPFFVRTRHGRIRALGTRFTVRDDGEATCVGVLEHAVEIRPAERPDTPQRLDAGQQLAFAAGGGGDVEPLADNSDAWSRGLLIASDWRLDRLLGELSRYRPGRIGWDKRAAGLRISGAFHLRDTDIVLGNLANTLPVHIRYFTRYWVRVEAAV